MVRVKHRYLVVQILYPERSLNPGKSPQDPILEFHRPTPGNITSAHLIRLLRDTISELFGDHGAGSCASSLAVRYFSPTTSTLIVRCARDRARLVWIALTLITHLPAVVEGRYQAGARGEACVMRVLRNSGSIRKSEERIVEMARRDILRLKGLEGRIEGDALAGLGIGGERDTGRQSLGMGRSRNDGPEDEDEEDEDDMDMDGD